MNFAIFCGTMIELTQEVLTCLVDIYQKFNVFKPFQLSVSFDK